MAQPKTHKMINCSKCCGIEHSVLAIYFTIQVIFVLFAKEYILYRVDDSFYYFGIARNVVEKGLFSFDGVNLTNGFQALWQFMVIGITWCAKQTGVERPETFVKVYLIFCALLNTCSAVVAFRLITKVFQQSIRVKYVVMGFILWFPGITFSLLCGMENSINWLLLLSFFNLIVQDDGEVNPSQCLTNNLFALIFLSCLMAYARVDNTIILATVAVFFFFKQPSLHVAKKIAIWGGTTFISWMPLLIWNKYVFGVPLPLSGAIKLWHSKQMLASMGVVEYSLVALKGVMFSYAGIVVSSIGMGYYELLKPLVVNFGLNKMLFFAGGLLVLFLAVLVVFSKKNNHSLKSTCPGILPLLVFTALCHLVINVFLLPREWMYAGIIWYFLVQYLCFFIVVGWFLQIFMNSLLSDTMWLGLKRFYPFLYLASVLPIIFISPNLPSEQELKYIGAQWLNENLPEGSRIGAQNAGVTGYFSKYPVTNLDGLVNDREYFEKYLKVNDIQTFMRSQGITYIADHCAKGYLFDDLYQAFKNNKLIFLQEGNEPGLYFCVAKIKDYR